MSDSDDGDAGPPLVHAAGVVARVFYPRPHEPGMTARVELEIHSGRRTDVRAPLLSVAPWYDLRVSGFANEKGDVEADAECGSVAYTRRAVTAADMDDFLRAIPKLARRRILKLVAGRTETPPDAMLAAIEAHVDFSFRVASSPAGVYARIHLLQELAPRYYKPEKLARLATPELVSLLHVLRTKPHRLCFRPRYPRRWPISELTCAQLRAAAKQYGVAVKPAVLRAAELNDRMRHDVKECAHSYSVKGEIVRDRLGYFRSGLDYLVRKDVIVVEDDKRLYLRRVHDRKVSIATAVHAIIARRAANGFMTVEEARERAVWARPPSGEQRAALDHLVTHPVCVVKGRPGSGKSTLIAAAVSLYDDNEVAVVDVDVGAGEDAKSEVNVASFTGRAVERLRALVPADMAHTLHHCAIKAENARRDGAPSPYAHVRCIIIDETSMTDASILSRFLKAFPNLAHLVLVGDGDQLPPIGYGDVMSAFSSAFPTITLHENHRASKASAVIARDNAERIQRGEMIRYEATGYASAAWRLPAHPVVLVPRSEAPDNDIAVVLRALRAAGVAEDKMQIMTHTNRDVDMINKVCMRVYRHREWQRGLYSVGDKICLRKNFMATLRSSEVSNGEIGRIAALEDVDSKGRVVGRPADTSAPVARGADRRVSFVSDSGAQKQWFLRDVPLSTIAHGWAVTTHKMQGSEQATCLIYVPRIVGNHATRNLFYTASTRAQDQTIIIGTRDDLQRMIDNPARPRRSFLAERLRAVPAADAPPPPAEEEELWLGNGAAADDADDANGDGDGDGDGDDAYDSADELPDEPGAVDSANEPSDAALDAAEAAAKPRDPRRGVGSDEEAELDRLPVAANQGASAAVAAALAAGAARAASRKRARALFAALPAAGAKRARR